MTTDRLRQAYLDFFRAKDHRVFPSDSLIPAGDASLLFTGAGMNQFKPYFLGLKKDLKRAASCQKCLRTADLDRVGKTANHHSFFEMLGNFSFGDYFKEDAIAWGWEFVTRVLKIPAKKLWVSVYEEDEEAFGLWKKKIGLAESKIVRLDATDNFWPSNARADGPNGPCGPCSEIYVGDVPGQGVEIWNLVFTQFDRQSDGTLKDLPQKNIDTGMGLERTAAVLQGVGSNFETDHFEKIRGALRSLMRPKDRPARGSQAWTHENAAMDHARAVVFAIADGALPSNEGRGYVSRKLIRLGSDHLERSGDPVAHRTLYQLVPVIVQTYGAVYPELVDKQKTISAIMENEEKQYEESSRRAENTRQGTMKAEEYAFMLYDTYGLPIDKIREKFAKDGLAFDEKVFSELMRQQKDRSRASSKIAGEIFSKDESILLADGLPPSRFLGYEVMESPAKLLRVGRRDEKTSLIFDQTPFYAESGGQVGDTGLVTGKNFKARVLDTQAMGQCLVHYAQITEGSPQEGETCFLRVDADRRADIMKNHTATHLLHAALRKILGEHVKQSGSLVAPDYLRFDFTHFKALDPETLETLEAMVNEEIRQNIRLDKQVMPKEEAMKKGALAFFGEKYDEAVRVVTIGDFSKELCGGTHLNSTGEIELFKITSEGSIQAGVRRLEAVTGRYAREKMESLREELGVLAKQFHSAAQVGALSLAVEQCVRKTEDLKSRLEEGVLSPMRRSYDKYFEESPPVGLVRFFVREEPLATPDLFQKTYAYLKNAKGPFAVLWQCGAHDKVTFAVGCSPDLPARGFHAGNIVKAVSQVVEGNGGGRPEFAIGGGKRVDKAHEAVLLGEKIITRQLTELKGNPT